MSRWKIPEPIPIDWTMRDVSTARITVHELPDGRQQRRIELAELVNEPWALAQPESGWGRAAMAAFRASGLDYPRAMVVSNSPEMRMSLVATGHFLTIVASSMLRFRTTRPELKVLPVELPMARGPVGIVTLKNRTLNPIAKLFIQHAHEAAKALAKRK